MSVTIVVTWFVLLASVGIASAQGSSKLNVTEAEKAACSTDAMQLCSDTYPDEDRLLACMRTKREQLSERCRPVFDAGLKRRKL